LPVLFGKTVNTINIDAGIIVANYANVNMQNKKTAKKYNETSKESKRNIVLLQLNIIRLYNIEIKINKLTCKL